MGTEKEGRKSKAVKRKEKDPRALGRSTAFDVISAFPPHQLNALLHLQALPPRWYVSHV